MYLKCMQIFCILFTFNIQMSLLHTFKKHPLCSNLKKIQTIFTSKYIINNYYANIYILIIILILEIQYLK